MVERGWRAGALGWLLVVGVGLAFADASVVVLALPSVYGQFNSTIVRVSWVLTGYAAVVTVVGMLLAVLHRRIPPAVLVGGGLAVFAAASVVCGTAPSLAVLLAGRCVQGAGAAALLAGALPALATLHGPVAGRAAWGWAAVVGLAIGPALGGVLTELFSWRAIFLAQAPLAVAALAAVADPRVRGAREPRAAHRPRVLALAGLVFLSGALVGALFLSVLLVIEIWRHNPLTGAAVVSALPVATFLVRPVAVRAAPVWRVLGGAVCLAGGLAALGLLPSSALGWAVAALALCGAGLGLLSAALDPVAVGPRAGVRDASLAAAARHAGLVLGLALIAPVLSHSLDRATVHAEYAGAGTVLEGRVSVQEKVKVALAVRDQLSANPRGKVPDLEATVAHAGVRSAAGRELGHDLATRIEAVLTRAFRPAFAVAAGLGGLVLLPGLAVLAVRRRRRRPAAVPDPEPEPDPDPVRPRRSTSSAALAGVVVLVLATGAVLGGELAAGARDHGTVVPTDACHTHGNRYPGSGLDAMLQRLALATVDKAACQLHVSREGLVLGLDGHHRPGVPVIDRKRLEAALRSSLLEAIDEAHLPGFIANPLRNLAKHAPVSELLDRLGIPH
ncbi:MAG: MFS transporter [Mycobacteriales bacterium]